MDEQNTITLPQVEEKKEVVKHDTMQMQRFREAYIRLGNATKAYLELHPNVTYGSARELGSRMLAKIDMPSLMEDMGLTDRALVGQLITGITKPTKMEKVKQYEGGRADFREVPDWTARNKYLELSLKVKKKLTSDNINNIQNNIADMTVQVVNYADVKKVEEIKDEDNNSLP